MLFRVEESIVKEADEGAQSDGSAPGHNADHQGKPAENEKVDSLFIFPRYPPVRDKRFGNAGSACGVTDIWLSFIRDGGHWKPRCTATLLRSYRQRRQLLRTE